jgi:hypothetical protein
VWGILQSRACSRKPFDQDLLNQLPATIERIRRIMNGSSAKGRNALTLLQLGLEHFHPLEAGLLWVTGLEAISIAATARTLRSICALT